VRSSAKPNSSRPQRRRWRRRVAVSIPIVVVAGVIGLGGAITCRPGWYQPASIDYTRLENDKRAQLDLENRISRDLNRGQPVEIELSQEQVNRWIAARDELWPGEVPSIEPFRRPQVFFLDDNRVRLAALVSKGGVRSVVSLTFRVRVAGEAVVFERGRMRAGVLPAPQRLLTEVLGRVAPRLNLSETAFEQGHFRVPAEGVWRNGRRRFRITDVTIHDGTARVRMEPL